MSLSQYAQTYVFILFIARIGLLVESQSCNIAYECVGTAWTLLSDSISGAGYKSLFGSNTSIIANYPWNIQCNGAYSCTEISFILSQYNVMCRGSHSCANIAGTSYIDTSDDVYCYGSHSCTNSNIRANNVYCSGDQSCNYANISALRVWADAAYSLYGATIDSKNITGELFVYLWGYQSGFGANILCRSGDVCNIFCYYNGCQMLYLLCEDDTNCNLIMSSNDPTITSSPIQKLADFDANFYDMKYMNHDSNALCNNSSKIVAYDNYQQQQVAIDIYNGGVCCRGSQSCQLADTIQVTAYVPSPDIIVCSGDSSCASTIITTTGPTFCEGSGSCFSTTINGSDNVYCLGGSACGQSVITGAKNVYCSGPGSCANGRIQSNGNDTNIYLLSHNAGAGLQIYCKVGDECNVTCGAVGSCSSNTLLFCNDNCLVHCNDDTGCPVGTYSSIQLRAPTVNPSQSPSQSPTNPSKSPTLNPSSLTNTTTITTITTTTAVTAVTTRVANDSHAFSFVYSVFIVLLCYMWVM